MSNQQLFSNYVSSYVFALAKNSYEKRARIMLMKLTKAELYLLFPSGADAIKIYRLLNPKKLINFMIEC